MGRELDPLGPGRLKRQEFMVELRNALEWPEPSFDERTELRGHENWDSAGMISTMMFIDERLGRTVETKSLQSVTTVHDVIALVSDVLEPE